MLHSWRRSLGIACFIDCAQFSSWWGVSHAINVARITAASFDQGNFPSSCSSNTSNNSQWQQQLLLLLWPVASGRQAGRQTVCQAAYTINVEQFHHNGARLPAATRCQLPLPVASCCCCQLLLLLLLLLWLLSSLRQIAVPAQIKLVQSNLNSSHKKHKKYKKCRQSEWIQANRYPVIFF